MKPLPCDTPKCNGATDAAGRVKLSGQPVREVRCMACKRVTFISAARWSGLRELSIDELRERGIDPTLDLVGALGADRETTGRRHTKTARVQAEDLYAYGFRGAEDLWLEDKANEAERQEQDALSRGATPEEISGEPAR